jgi:hypothetical protein
MAKEYRLVSYADGKGTKAGALIGERNFSRRAIDRR